MIPLHGTFLRNLGIYINEILWLEDLAAQCAEDGIYDFLFTAAPLNVERSSGAPINPVVLKATGEDADEGGDKKERDDENGGRERKGKGKGQTRQVAFVTPLDGRRYDESVTPSRSRSDARLTFPVTVVGRSSTNAISRGYS